MAYANVPYNTICANCGKTRGAHNSSVWNGREETWCLKTVNGVWDKTGKTFTELGSKQPKRTKLLLLGA